MKKIFNDDFEIEKTKFISKVILVSFLIIIMVFTVSFLTLKYVMKNFNNENNIKQFYQVEKSVSPNGNYIIEIQGNGPRWPFGSEDLKIIAYKKTSVKNSNKRTFKTQLCNDGKGIGESNYDIDWSNDGALITISGEEQKNEYIFVDFKNNIKFKHKGLDYKVKSLNEFNIIKSFSYNDNFSNRNVELYNINIDFLIDGKYVSMEECFNEKKVDIEDFIITMDYEVEDKVAVHNWENKGNADVYKNDDLTLIICRYDRYNKDYEFIHNENYLKYIISDNNLEYNYDLCKP